MSSKRAAEKAEDAIVSKRGKARCSTGDWCSVEDLTGNIKTCNKCISAARMNTRNRKMQRQQQQQATAQVKADFEAAAGEVPTANRALSNVIACKLAETVLRDALGYSSGHARPVILESEV